MYRTPALCEDSCLRFVVAHFDASVAESIQTDLPGNGGFTSACQGFIDGRAAVSQIHVNFHFNTMFYKNFAHFFGYVNFF